MRGAGPWAFALTGLMLATAGAALADASGRAQLAQLSGSERLAVFAQTKALDAGDLSPATVGALNDGLERLGFGSGVRAGQVLAKSATLAPTLGYDGNLNGGYPGSVFDVGGIVLTADPAYVAVPAATVGAEMSARLRLSLGRGQIFEASADATTAYAPTRDLSKSSAAASACAKTHLQGWTFLDLCAEQGASYRSLGQSLATTTSAGLTTLFATGAAAHEVTMTLSNTTLSGGNQGGVSLGWTSVWDGAVTRLQAGIAAPVPGQTVQRARIEAGAAWVMADHPIDLGLWASQSEGGTTLGIARRDQAQGLSLSTEWTWPSNLPAQRLLGRGPVTTELGLSQTQSTISLYNDRQISFTARFALRR